MAIVRIPIPESWIPGKHYVLEFDNERMSGVELQRDLSDGPEGSKIFTGSNSLTLKFESFDVAPRWVEVDWLGRAL